jgi:hypothetical protein
VAPEVESRARSASRHRAAPGAKLTVKPAGASPVHGQFYAFDGSPRIDFTWSARDPMYPWQVWFAYPTSTPTTTAEGGQNYTLGATRIPQ